MNDNSRLLTRPEASDFLLRLGYRVAPATLAKKACVGGGPRMTVFGRKVLYEPDALLDWVQAQSQIRAHTFATGDPRAA